MIYRSDSRGSSRYLTAHYPLMLLWTRSLVKWMSVGRGRGESLLGLQWENIHPEVHTEGSTRWFLSLLSLWLSRVYFVKAFLCMYWVGCQGRSFIPMYFFLINWEFFMAQDVISLGIYSMDIWKKKSTIVEWSVV